MLFQQLNNESKACNQGIVKCKVVYNLHSYTDVFTDGESI